MLKFASTSFGSISVLLCMILPQLTAASLPCRNNTEIRCMNGGYCNVDGKCECPSGYSGSVCEQAAVSVIVLIVVCVMPLITWSIVCFYGCNSLHTKKAARERRRRQRASRDRRRCEGPRWDDDHEISQDDEPPEYYQAVYENPVAICGQNFNPDWIGGTLDYPDLPPHYEDLALVGFKTGATRVVSAGTELRGNTASVAVTIEGAVTPSLPGRCHLAPMLPEGHLTATGVASGEERVSTDVPPPETLEQGLNESPRCCSRGKETVVELSQLHELTPGNPEGHTASEQTSTSSASTEIDGNNLIPCFHNNPLFQNNQEPLIIEESSTDNPATCVTLRVLGQ